MAAKSPAGKQDIIDAGFFQRGDHGFFLGPRDLDVFKENQLTCRRFFIGQIIIKAVIRQGEKKFIGIILCPSPASGTGVMSRAGHGTMEH